MVTQSRRNHSRRIRRKRPTLTAVSVAYDAGGFGLDPGLAITLTQDGPGRVIYDTDDATIPDGAMFAPGGVSTKWLYVAGSATGNYTITGELGEQFTSTW